MAAPQELKKNRHNPLIFKKAHCGLALLHASSHSGMAPASAFLELFSSLRFFSSDQVLSGIGFCRCLSTGMAPCL
jgi:hypothetical protein